MRRAKSYSIIDHRLLHGGYFQRLSHQALALYLFLVVVGDGAGKSFYAIPTLQTILHFGEDDLQRSREALIEAGLITYRKPYWWVCALSEPLRTKSHALKASRAAEVCQTPESIGIPLSQLMEKIRNQ